MTEILLVRHAQAYANLRDFTAFGNEDSPLTPRGIKQAHELNTTFRNELGIIPEEYELPIVASKYARTQQTATLAGFRTIDINPIINETDVVKEISSGNDVIGKHQKELWVPEDGRKRAPKFLDRVRNSDLDYYIYFTHGMFIASILLECVTQKIEVSVPFDHKRGYVPLQASITKQFV